MRKWFYVDITTTCRERVRREARVFDGKRKLECHYEAGALVVATSVKETEV